jgi:hypothetical protein
VRADTAIAGLALLLVLYRRLPETAVVPAAWSAIGGERSEHQPGLLRFGQRLREHLSTAPSVAETLAWIVRWYVLATHEAIAYSKLPNFTFRFRWERGRLRFYDLGLGRFDLTDMRHDAMSQLSRDLGLWEASATSARPGLTGEGRRLVREVFG